MTDERSSTSWIPAEAMPVLFAVALAIAAVGFFVGVGYEPDEELVVAPPPLASIAQTPVGDQPHPSVTYAEMRTLDLGPNAGFRTTIADLGAPEPETLDEPVPQSETLVALAQRADLRAYNGAPPVIPHAVDQIDSASCLACHRAGLRTGDVRAGRMPHEEYASCTQCHVERSAPPTALLALNTFDGTPAPTGGTRAWTGAPPTIPHATIMRSDCMSCHGPSGPLGLRTSHPERLSCTQCHAPSAELNQLILGATSFP
ncbi:MAG: nitrate reductase cytochrome c-type subunit [Planctomycetota bacterium]